MWTSRGSRGSNAVALQSTCAPIVAWDGLDRPLPPTPPRTEVPEVVEVEEEGEEEVVEVGRETTWFYLVGRSVSNLQGPPPKEEAWD